MWLWSTLLILDFQHLHLTEFWQDVRRVRRSKGGKEMVVKDTNYPGEGRRLLRVTRDKVGFPRGNLPGFWGRLAQPNHVSTKSTFQSLVHMKKSPSNRSCRAPILNVPQFTVLMSQGDDVCQGSPTLLTSPKCFWLYHDVFGEFSKRAVHEGGWEAKAGYQLRTRVDQCLPERYWDSVQAYMYMSWPN